MRDVDVVVIGGGPAGLSAAASAAQAGASVLVLEASREFGGLLGLQPQPLRDRLDLYKGMTGQAYVTTLHQDARAAGAELLAGTPVWDVDPELTVSFTHSGTAERVNARQLIVATGSTDGVATFQGWMLPGVLFTRAVHTTVSRGKARPGSRALVVGGGDEALIVARNLRDVGVEVVAVIDDAPEMTAMPDMLRDAEAAGVRLLAGHVILDATGKAGVKSVTVARVDGRSAAGASVSTAAMCKTWCSRHSGSTRRKPMRNSASCVAHWIRALHHTAELRWASIASAPCSPERIRSARSSRSRRPPALHV